MKVLIVSDRKESLKFFAQGLGGDVEWAADPDEVLKQAQGLPWNLVVVDALRPGLDLRGFLGELLRVNGLLHTAVISSMGEDDLMEHCAGLGVLCAIPAAPGWEDGARVMNQLCLFYDMG